MVKIWICWWIHVAIITYVNSVHNQCRWNGLMYALCVRLIFLRFAGLSPYPSFFPIIRCYMSRGSWWSRYQWGRRGLKEYGGELVSTQVEFSVTMFAPISLFSATFWFHVCIQAEDRLSSTQAGNHRLKKGINKNSTKMKLNSTELGAGCQVTCLELSTKQTKGQNPLDSVFPFFYQNLIISFISTVCKMIHSRGWLEGSWCSRKELRWYGEECLISVS